MTDFFMTEPVAFLFGGSRDPLEYPESGIAFRSICSIYCRHITGLVSIISVKSNLKTFDQDHSIMIITSD